MSGLAATPLASPVRRALRRAGLRSRAVAAALVLGATVLLLAIGTALVLAVSEPDPSAGTGGADDTPVATIPLPDGDHDPTGEPSDAPTNDGTLPPFGGASGD